MYKVTNILQQRNKCILKLKNIETGKILKLDLHEDHDTPFIGEVLEYTCDGDFQDNYDETVFMYSLHNDEINLNWYKNQDKEDIFI